MTGFARESYRVSLLEELMEEDSKRRLPLQTLDLSGAKSTYDYATLACFAAAE